MTQKGSALLVCAMTLLCLAGTSARADAALIAYICDDMLCTGGNDTIVTDQGPGDNFPGSAQVGQINAGALSVNGFTIVTNVTQSKPLIGSAAAPQMDLTFSAVTSDAISRTPSFFTRATPASPEPAPWHFRWMARSPPSALATPSVDVHGAAPPTLNWTSAAPISGRTPGPLERHPLKPPSTASSPPASTRTA